MSDTTVDINGLRERLASLSELEYEQQRVGLAAEHGIRVSALDKAYRKITHAALRVAARGADTPPVIFPDEMQLREVELTCLKVIASRNDPIRHVEYGGAAAIVSEQPGEVARIEVLTEATALRELAHHVTWLKGGREEILPTKPSREHVTLFLHTSQPRRVPIIKRIVEIPIPQKNGAPLKPGFNLDSGIYYSRTLCLREVPERPTRDHVEQARQIIHEPFQDFLFLAPADYAAILALQILPFIREFIAQQVPMVSARAAMQGTGKDYLIKVAFMPWGRYSLITPPASRDSDDAWAKRITTELMSGSDQFLITNVTSLFSNTLAGAITSGIWTDRILGGNQKFHLDPVLASWGMTENNATLGTDWPRRIMPSRIYSDTDPPSLRENFKVEDLELWLAMPEHRADIVWAILVWIRYWINAGCPEAPASVRRMSSFPTFRAVMGGLLHLVEVPGFGDNYMLLEDIGNSAESIWREFTDKWWKWAEREQKVAQLINQAGKRETIPLAASELVPIAKDVLGLFTRKPNEREPDDLALVVSLGKMLSRRKTGLFGRYRIMAAASKIHNQTLWKLVETGARSSDIEDLEIDRLASADGALPADGFDFRA